MASTGKSNNLCNAPFLPMLHIAHMNEPIENPRNFLRDWRRYRKMTQEALAEKAGTNSSMINHLENGKRGLSHKWLVRLAPILSTSPGFLLDHNPYEMPTDILEIWNRGNQDQRNQLLRVAEAIIPQAGGGLKH